MAVAKANARNLLPPHPSSPSGGEEKGGGLRIKFIHSDILQNVRMNFDVIVANLPYVPKKYYVSSIKYLRWEPKIALVDPIKDFDVYRRFFIEVGGHLNPKGGNFVGN